MDISKAIDYIEGMVGIVGFWNEWPDSQIRILYIYICTDAHRKKFTIEDARRVGITL